MATVDYRKQFAKYFEKSKRLGKMIDSAVRQIAERDLEIKQLERDVSYWRNQHYLIEREYHKLAQKLSEERQRNVILEAVRIQNAQTKNPT